MPVTRFICPDGLEWPVADCMTNCRMPQRCMMLPTLRAVVAQERNMVDLSVTELIGGTREAFFKRMRDYAVNPRKRMFALHGTAVHTINEGHTEGFEAERRLFGEYCSGSPDLYGNVLGDDRQTLGDLKVTSSYKIMKALGIYKVDVPTGEFYKTGARKGEPKTTKQPRFDGVKHLLEWALQVNGYRIMLEAEKKRVDAMVIQALCRDYGLQIAQTRNVTQEVYLIPINKISDHWLNKYYKTKASRLNHALATGEVPPICRSRERWHGRKCKDYCEVAEHCDCLDKKGAFNDGDFLANSDNKTENGSE